MEGITSQVSLIFCSHRNCTRILCVAKSFDLFFFQVKDMTLGLINKENQPTQEAMKKPLKPAAIKPTTGGEAKATQEVLIASSVPTVSWIRK